MLAVRLDADLEARLAAVVKSSGRSRSNIVREGLRGRVEELEDIALLEEALKTYDPAKNISMEQMRRELGLDS